MNKLESSLTFIPLRVFTPYDSRTCRLLGRVSRRVGWDPGTPTSDGRSPTDSKTVAPPPGTPTKLARPPDRHRPLPANGQPHTDQAGRPPATRTDAPHHRPNFNIRAGRPNAPVTDAATVLAIPRSPKCTVPKPPTPRIVLPGQTGGTRNSPKGRNNGPPGQFQPNGGGRNRDHLGTTGLEFSGTGAWPFPGSPNSRF